MFYNDGDEVPVLMNMMVIGQPGEEYAGLLQGEDPVCKEPKNQKPGIKMLNQLLKQNS